MSTEPTSLLIDASEISCSSLFGSEHCWQPFLRFAIGNTEAASFESDCKQ